jgi:hypothetical protein
VGEIEALRHSRLYGAPRTISFLFTIKELEVRVLKNIIFYSDN